MNSLRNRRQSVDISKTNRYSFQLVPIDNREVWKIKLYFFFKEM